jgi:hypothetical protein
MDGPEQRYFGCGQSCTDRITARAIHKPEMHSCRARDDKHVERTSQGWTDKVWIFGKSARVGLMRRMAGTFNGSKKQI